LGVFQKKWCAVFLIAFSGAVSAEIEDRNFLKEIFDGCLNEADPSIPIGNFFGYCGCVTADIARSMTKNEAGQIGLSMIEGGKEQEMRIMLANKKMKDAIVNCVPALLGD
jgi:hypothetical protein